MSSPGLNDAEVALIKAMLRRKMPNNKIQFYFNHPNRPVNSGRITEIKKGYRWLEIDPATNEQLDEFLTQFQPDAEGIVPANTQPEVPAQLPSATVFALDEQGLIAAVPDPPSRAPSSHPEQKATYIELCRKTENVLGAGHNLLGEMWDPLQRFQDALPEDMSKASVTIIWLRGNTLRSILRAHDEVKGLPDIHPGKLEPAYAERLRDIVETFNNFVVGDPKGRDLDQSRSGPTDRKVADQAIELVQNIASHSSEVATEATSSLIKEQIDHAVSAPSTIHGDQAAALAQRTSSNFVIAIVQNGLNAVRRKLGNEFSFAWREWRSGAYTAAGALTLYEHGAVVNFIVKYIADINIYINSVINNPTVSQAIQFIYKIFT